jgi:hypothetical protein
MADMIDANFFTSLDNTQPFFKLAIEGFAGSGKTYTMSQIAIGLHKRIKSKKPIAYFDTEKAGRHLRTVFKDAGVQILHRESRTLADLHMAMRMGRDGVFDILMIDSISHVWENYLQSYQSDKGKSRLEFADWGILKPKWKREFSEPFVHDRYHTIMCGRAGYEYVDEKDEHGKRQIYKSGVKMKVEGETAYEPDMLMYMERFEEILETKKKVWRECTILKDRSTLLDGKSFKNPTYKDFAPAVDRLLEDVVMRDPQEETKNTFQKEENRSAELRERDIIAAEIKGELRARWPGESADAKAARADAVWRIFNTRAWQKVEIMDVQILRHGLVTMRSEMTAVSDAKEQAAAEEAFENIGRAAAAQEEVQS